MSNEPAFPQQRIDASGYPTHDGMSLRDYFAANVLQGFCANTAVFAANGNSGWGLVNSTAADLCGYAFWLADAMLAERAKP